MRKSMMKTKIKNLRIRPDYGKQRVHQRGLQRQSKKS